MRYLGVFVLVMGLSSVFAKEKVLPEPREIVPIAQLDSRVIQELIAGAHPDMAIAIQPGTEVPLRFFHRESFFSLALNPNLTIKVDKLCYLRFVKRKVYISEDLAKWEKPNLLRGRMSANISPDGSGCVIETTTAE